jgi:hypothetical protein
MRRVVTGFETRLARLTAAVAERVVFGSGRLLRGESKRAAYTEARGGSDLAVSLAAHASKAATASTIAWRRLVTESRLMSAVYSGVIEDQVPESVRTSPSRTAGSKRVVRSPARCASVIAFSLAALLATIASIGSSRSARSRRCHVASRWTSGCRS